MQILMDRPCHLTNWSNRILLLAN